MNTAFQRQTDQILLLIPVRAQLLVRQVSRHRELVLSSVCLSGRTLSSIHLLILSKTLGTLCVQPQQGRRTGDLVGCVLSEASKGMYYFHFPSIGQNWMSSLQQAQLWPTVKLGAQEKEVKPLVSSQALPLCASLATKYPLHPSCARGTHHLPPQGGNSKIPWFANTNYYI